MRVWPKNYWPPSYWVPSYWPPPGEAPTTGESIPVNETAGVDMGSGRTGGEVED